LPRPPRSTLFPYTTLFRSTRRMPRRTSTSPTGRSGTRATSSPKPAGSSDPSAGESTGQPTGLLADQSQSALADPSAADGAHIRRPVPRQLGPAFCVSAQGRGQVLGPVGERSALRARVQALTVDSVTRALR